MFVRSFDTWPVYVSQLKEIVHSGQEHVRKSENDRCAFELRMRELLCRSWWLVLVVVHQSLG